MNKKQLNGYTMAIIGFLMIFVNALNYIFGWKIGSPILEILGLIFVIFGLNSVRKNK